nr:unnamed protein product [Callosobruchus analis]
MKDHGPLYMDNFYNSVALAKILLENKTYCTETLRASLRGNSNEVTVRKLKKGENISVFNEGVHVGKWRDKHPRYAGGTELHFMTSDSGLQTNYTCQTPKPKRPVSCFQHKISVISEKGKGRAAVNA